MIRCLIVDDEPLARSILREHISATSDLELVADLSSATEVIPIIRARKIDVIFMDIHMPVISGLDFIRMDQNLPPVILTTAFSEYALESFLYNVIDYLVKPITFERFLQSIHKLRSVTKAAPPLPPKPQHFFLKSGYLIEQILREDILYVESLSNYCSFHVGKKKIVSYLSIKEIMSQMDDADFIQVHKSFLVALKHIRQIQHDVITMSDHSKLPLSKSYKEAFFRKVEETMLRKK